MPFIKINTLVVIFLVLIVVFAGCKKHSGSTPTYTPQVPAYYNLFNRTNGWIGADIASSIPLDSNQTLWLFGDTWYGSIANNKRNGTITAHNTIGIQAGFDPSTATLNYYFGNNNGTFFNPSDSVGEIWPMHGIVIDSQLYIFFVQVTSTGQGGVWGFQLSGSRLIQVSNPFAPPSQWQMTQYIVPNSFFNSSIQIAYGAAVFAQDSSIYIYGTETDSATADRYLLLAKAPRNGLTNFSSWLFYSQGQWVNNYQSADKLTDNVGFDLSVSYLSTLGKYVLVTTAGGLSKNINIQYADSAWGTWTAPVTVYQCPEMSWSSNIFCYAGKGHPELSANNQLIITYASNSNNLADIVNNAQLYWPRFIQIPL